jgi:hypothetical protein
MKTKLTGLLVLGLLALACGPDLNAPGTTNVTGTWVSTDTVATIWDFRLTLTQTPSGAISGNWTGTGGVGNEYCGDHQCFLTNIVVGGNTVVGIAIDVLGAGRFTGQMNGTTLRGDILRQDGDFRIKFSKAP